MALCSRARSRSPARTRKALRNLNTSRRPPPHPHPCFGVPDTPPPFPRTNQTNLVPPLVLSGHVVYPTSLRPRQTLPPQISPRALLPLGMRKSTHSSTAPLLLHHSSSIQSSAFATRRGARAQNHASSTQNLPARTRALRRPHLARREREHASGRFGARVRVRVVLTGPQRSGTWYGVRDAACPISTG
jgi:hypothetical protein